jgi:eukaryotic-like serine/threonine-protein kinase
MSTETDSAKPGPDVADGAAPPEKPQASSAPVPPAPPAAPFVASAVSTPGAEESGPKRLSVSTPAVTPAPAGEEGAVPREGDILAGKYRIDRVLGQGGMGVVVAAHHTTLRQNVAIKYLLPEAAKRDDSSARFLREAQAAFSIQSEHVARVMDVGTLETGSPYMVMEYLTGSDLGAVLAQRGPLAVQDAVEYILQASEAIAEAHALGIIHRDLKPANLFLTTRADGSPLVKVLDFGLSKATKPDTMDASLTAANVIMGSPFYMSPEQIRSLKGLDARTDIWALGVILYQLLTGVRPFEAESLGSLFFTIGADTPAPLRTRRPELPEALDNAILKCLEKDPRVRTQSVAELARAIAPFGTDDARISVERIHRVLSDGTPFPRRISIGDSTAGSALLEDAAKAATAGDEEGIAPTLAIPARDSAPLDGAAPAVSNRANPPSEKLKSGSMAAVARDGSSPPSMVPPPRAKGRGGLVGVVLGVAVLAVTGVTVLSLRKLPPDTAQAGSPTTTTAPTTTAATPPAPAPADSQAAPGPDPSATASAATTADAAPASASAAPAKPPKLPLKPPAQKKPKDPLNRR